MLNQVADGVWVRQSAWVLSNAIAVRGEDGLILVDPGIDGSHLNQLADVLIPLLDPRRPGQVGAYESALSQDWLSAPDRSNLEQARGR